MRKAKKSMNAMFASRLRLKHYRSKKKARPPHKPTNEQTLSQKELLDQHTSDNERLKESVITDPLTGLRNRRFYSLVIGNEMARVEQEALAGEQYGPKEELLFFVLDLDNFKQTNDRYGRDAGDLVLIEVARRLEAMTRKSDFVLRWGGEEFLVISRGTDRTEGEHLAERILKAVGSKPVSLEDGTEISVTASIGWAPFPWDPERPYAMAADDVLRLADRALCCVKQEQRNIVISAKPRSENHAL
jgi:diguanylate cyclase (GGDEF)-like protein